ncbi:PIG-L family deacetylase [Metallosphaera sp.]|uniref:PIG-L deacetylase family protein n=1 Tax=Metallosphaera sp. TaxID=2020860 RepID=UPI003162D628
MKVLVISPHPDDETLCCGGSILNHVRRGDKVTVVIVTDGRYGSPSPELRGTDELVELRKKEALMATSKLGVEDVRFLNFEDSKVMINQDKIIKKIASVIGEGQDLIYSPLPMDGHQDHASLGRIMTKLAPTSLFYLIWIPSGLKAHSRRVGLIKLRNWERIEKDIEKFREVKLRALEEYKSQLGGFSGDFLRRLTADHERFYRRPLSALRR